MNTRAVGYARLEIILNTRANGHRINTEVEILTLPSTIMLDSRKRIVQRLFRKNGFQPTLVFPRNPNRSGSEHDVIRVLRITLKKYETYTYRIKNMWSTVVQQRLLYRFSNNNSSNGICSTYSVLLTIRQNRVGAR